LDFLQKQSKLYILKQMHLVEKVFFHCPYQGKNTINHTL
jgi:hypothetical protein